MQMTRSVEDDKGHALASWQNSPASQIPHHGRVFPLHRPACVLLLTSCVAASHTDCVTSRRSGNDGAGLPRPDIKDLTSHRVSPWGGRPPCREDAPGAPQSSPCGRVLRPPAASTALQTRGAASGAERLRPHITQPELQPQGRARTPGQAASGRSCAMSGQAEQLGGTCTPAVANSAPCPSGMTF